MNISDSFTSEHVGFAPVGICFGSPEHFPVDPALGNVALSWKHLSPAIPVTVLQLITVEEEPGEVILNVDVHCLAAFDEGIEECRNFRTGLGDAEKEGLSSYHKGSYHVFGGLVPRCCTWNIEECHEASIDNICLQVYNIYVAFLFCKKVELWYIYTTQMAVKWDISSSLIQALCNEGLIDGQ